MHRIKQWWDKLDWPTQNMFIGLGYIVVVISLAPWAIKLMNIYFNWVLN